MSNLKKGEGTRSAQIFGSDNPNVIEVKDLKKIYSSKELIEEVKAVDGI